MIGHSQEALLKYFGGLSKNKDERVAAEGISFISNSLEKNEEIIWGLNSCNLGKITINSMESIVSPIILVTNKRLYFSGTDGASGLFIRMSKSGSVNLKDIHAMNLSTDLLGGHQLKFKALNDQYLYDDPYHNAKELLAKINLGIEKGKTTVSKKQTVVKQEVSAADEIRKFKSLLDEGIISQEEFDKKKKQLLGV